MARSPVRSLKRLRSSREPKRRFVLFCEGLNTEPAYFGAIGRNCVNALIEVKRGVGVPMTIAKKAVERKRRRTRNSFEEKDEVWAVFDRDNHPNFNGAVSMCEANGLGVASSNPCFDLWLVLHEREYERPESRRGIQNSEGAGRAASRVR